MSKLWAEPAEPAAHLKMALDLGASVCYTEENDAVECVNHDEYPLYMPWEYLESFSKSL